MLKTLLFLHASVALAGATGVFGKWITISTLPLVWYRLLISSILCILVVLLTRKKINFSLRDFLRIGFVGAILATHWFFFYGSIKLSNVSVGVVCFSSVSFFTALLEPLVNKHRVSIRELVFGLLAVVGILLIFSFDSEYRLGVAAGILSAICASLFTIVNTKVGREYSSTKMLVGELAGGSITASVLVPIALVASDYTLETVAVPGLLDGIKLMAFCGACTVLLQFMQIKCLQKVPTFTFNLTYGLEPIYSIVYAVILFQEFREWSVAFVTGLCLIIIPIIAQTVIFVKKKRAAQISGQA